MSEMLRKLEPLEVYVPDRFTVGYPGNDAWLQLESGVVAPGADPAWVSVESVAVPATPGKALNPTTNPPQIKVNQSVFGGSSLFQAGNGYALTTPDSPDWDLGGGDFTIEGRYRFAVARKALFSQVKADGTDRAWEMTCDTGSAGDQQFNFSCATGAGAAFEITVDRSFTPNLNQWYHLAVVRWGANLMLFVDGVQLGATYNIGSAVIRGSAQPLRIGGDARAAGNDFNGWSDELRISNVARWTGAFTPPGAPYVKDAYTLLLCHFDGADGTVPTQDDTGTPAGVYDPGSDPAWAEVER